MNAGKTAISGTPIREEDFTLDPTGNWTDYVQKTSGSTDLDQDRTHNKVNEITNITETTGTAWITPVEDKNGNMTTVPKPSSLSNGLTLTYDAWNRLSEVADGATIVARYEYDGLNRRIKRHFDSQAPDDPDGIDTYVHYFYNDQWQILETRDTTTESDQPENLQPKYQHVWSPRYIDAPILRDENTDQDSLCDDQRLYYLNDANFNVTSLIDTAGNAVEHYLYDPYGKVTIYGGGWSATRSTSSYNNVTLYTGRELDPESGIMHYRWRFYSTELGRFVSRDAIGYVGGLSLHAYVNGNPTGQTDPKGSLPPVMWDPNPMPGITPWEAKDPKYTPGFKICHRDIEKTGQDCCEDAAIDVLNTCYVQHCYIQYGPLNPDGTPAKGTKGWGIGGGGAGTLPSSEGAFGADSCSSLTKGSSLLKYGKGKWKFKPGSDATDEDIQDCISKVPMSKGYKPWGKGRYNCVDWAREAAAACGLQ